VKLLYWDLNGRLVAEDSILGYFVNEEVFHCEERADVRTTKASSRVLCMCSSGGSGSGGGGGVVGSSASSSMIHS